MGRKKPIDVVPKLVTFKDAAKMLGIRYTTLRGMTERGVLPVVKIPTSSDRWSWYVEVEELDRFIEKYRISPGRE